MVEFPVNLRRRPIFFPILSTLDGQGEKNIEGLFTSPDFHRTHATQTNRLTAELAAAKETLAALSERWEELEAIKSAGRK